MTRDDPAAAATLLPFLRNTWYVAMWAQDLEPGKPFARTILSEPLVLFRREDGRPVAMIDRCPHRFAALSMGRILPGDRIMCPYHGLEFGVDGACVHNPHGNGQVPAGAQIRTYPIVEKHSLLWIWMGERAPDESTIPDYSCFDDVDPIRVTKRDYLRMDAGCELVINNLLDTSHTSYLHAGILGTGDSVVARTEIRENGNTVRISRISDDSQVPSMYRQITPAHIQRTTKWSVMHWTAPSNIIIQGGVGGPGGDPSQAWGYDGCHLLTPETERSTHYHFAAVRWNLISDDLPENEAIRQRISQLRHFAFAEQDAPVIEKQQQRIDACRVPLQPVLLAIDAGAVRCQRVLQRLLEQER